MHNTSSLQQGTGGARLMHNTSSLQQGTEGARLMHNTSSLQQGTGGARLVGVASLTSVGHEGRCEQHVSRDGGHLALEGLAAGLPALLLVCQAAQQSLAPVNLGRRRGGGEEGDEMTYVTTSPPSSSTLASTVARSDLMALASLMSTAYSSLY